MVLLYVQHSATAAVAVQSAALLAVRFGKPLGLLAFADAADSAERLEADLHGLLADRPELDAKVFVYEKNACTLGDLCEELEASFLLVQMTSSRQRDIQRQLNACRELRIPYLLYKPDFTVLNPDKVLVPVTFLEEEYEKAQFASAFGRFFSSRILLLQPNDYGSKAERTVGKIAALLDKFQATYSIERARTDSFKVEREAVRRAVDEAYGLVLLSASRDYGLDDLLFGPKELHLVRRSPVPILLINPRGDLYSLCD